MSTNANTNGSPRIGRPPEAVPQDIADEVVEWIAEGRTLRSYCRQPGKPSRRTVDDWRAKDKEFAARIARAREDGADCIAEEALAIADAPGTHEDDVQHRKLQIETRIKLLAKWHPQRYGDRQVIAGDPHAPLVSLDDGERAARIQAILAAVEARSRQ